MRMGPNPVGIPVMLPKRRFESAIYISACIGDAGYKRGSVAGVQTIGMAKRMFEVHGMSSSTTALVDLSGIVPVHEPATSKRLLVCIPRPRSGNAYVTVLRVSVDIVKIIVIVQTEKGFEMSLEVVLDLGADLTRLYIARCCS